MLMIMKHNFCVLTFEEYYEGVGNKQYSSDREVEGENAIRPDNSGG